MKAVNLLPFEARHASGNVTLKGASPATLGLLGGLALAVVIAFGYVTLSNSVSDRRAELATVNAQTSAAQQRAAVLKPYGDLAALRGTTLDQVRSLAGGRYDWPVVLSRFARALPSDATLTSFNGAMGAPVPATGAATGPTVTLAGCTTSHSSVGTIMDRLRAVEAVSDVTLQSSTVDAAGPAGASSSTGAGCGRAETFALTVTLDPVPGATTTAAAATVTPTTPAPTSTTPATTSTTAATSSTTTATPAATTSTPATTTPAGTP